MSVTLEAISEDEATFLRGVTVQVEVHLEPALLRALNDRSLCAIDSGLLVRTGLSIKSVQVVVMCVQSVVTARHSVRIDQWYHLESVSFQ